MRIEPLSLTIRELCYGYADHAEDGVVAYGGKHCEFEEMHGDHKTPWAKGGRTSPDNLQLLCRACNLDKGAK